MSGGLERYGRATAALIRRELLMEIRTREALQSTGFFSILIVVLFGFAMGARPVQPFMAPGMLWIAFSFAGVLGLNRSFGRERDNGCLTGLMLCPVDRSSVFIAKCVVQLILMLAVELITLPVFSIFLQVSLLPHLGPILLINLLGTAGFAAAGTLLSAIAGSSRARDVLLPIMLYPLWIPLLLAAVRSMALVLDGRPLASASGWLCLMGLYDLIFFVLGLILFEYVFEE
ncbi:MAG: heme exporter protein CcmB [Candidatus Eisenbacteria bacterium]|uniref:Heme exporter protein B n=1 Tax=Eiseniibacteriota bacterium TaxID=2212470 RepID=A0A948RRE3_UNCEI|nr:heme exporter protein CcmB [Candidatus Eisenbacteria bacterium]MBU1950148.1 heme exporter protein CcmB [Candidatus Eisenbacteria bacterium]MBU2689600.1 heme exporter protein CcmB [Candidatus Eisenbacteria bacterium]